MIIISKQNDTLGTISTKAYGNGTFFGLILEANPSIVTKNNDKTINTRLETKSIKDSIITFIKYI